MRRFSPVAVSMLVVISAACSSTPAGPSSPAPQETMTGAEARIQAAVRAAAIDFVEAYAMSPQDGGAALDETVTTQLMHDWVHWGVVRNRAFAGEIVGTPGEISVGPAQPVVVEQGTYPRDRARQVEMSAAIELSVTPEDEQTRSVAGGVEGPMLVVAGADGRWRVSNFSRAGVPLSTVFQVLDGLRFQGGGRTTITIDSFVAAPVWDFNLVVDVRSGPPVSLSPSGVALVDAGGAMLDEGTVIGSLSSVAAGESTEWIVGLAPQPSAEGLSLRIDLASDDEIPALEVPLGDLITPLAPGPSSPGPTATPTP